MVQTISEAAGVGNEQTISSRAGDEAIDVHVAARRDRLPIVRSLLDHALLLADWPIDDIADLKLAVDEVCGQLIEAASGDRLRVSVRDASPEAVVAVSARVPAEFRLDRSGVGWHVVESVTDARQLTYGDDDEFDRELVVELAKRPTPVLPVPGPPGGSPAGPRPTRPGWRFRR